MVNLCDIDTKINQNLLIVRCGLKLFATTMFKCFSKCKYNDHLLYSFIDIECQLNLLKHTSKSQEAKHQMRAFKTKCLINDEFERKFKFLTNQANIIAHPIYDKKYLKDNVDMLYQNSIFNDKETFVYK